LRKFEEMEQAGGLQAVYQGEQTVIYEVVQ
jgi:hypothetical protein